MNGVVLCIGLCHIPCAFLEFDPKKGFSKMREWPRFYKDFRPVFVYRRHRIDFCNTRRLYSLSTGSLLSLRKHLRNVDWSKTRTASASGFGYSNRRGCQSDNVPDKLPSDSSDKDGGSSTKPTSEFQRYAAASGYDVAFFRTDDGEQSI